MIRSAAILVTILVTGAACGGGSKSCQDACQAVSSCAARLQAQAIDVNACTAGCQAGTCQNKQQLIDCAVGAQCNSTLDAYNSALNACQNSSGCTFTL